MILKKNMLNDRLQIEYDSAKLYTVVEKKVSVF